MNRNLVFIVAVWCACMAATLGFGQSGTIQGSNFGFQCGYGVATNCKNPAGPPQMVWPTVIDRAANPSGTTGGLIRLHDSGTFWSQLNPAVGTYNWTTLDQWLDLISQHEPIEVAQQFIWTPCWASSKGTCGASSIAPTGTNGYPDDLTAAGSPNFNAFVTAFVQHCTAAGHCVKDVIKYYQIWNEWNLSGHWTGSITQLYQMIAPAVAIIRANVPGAVVVMPSTSPGGVSRACDFISALNADKSSGPGGVQLSDWVDFHLYLTATETSTYTPEDAWYGYIQNGATGFLDVMRGVTIPSCAPRATSAPGWSGAPWVNSELNFSTSDDLWYHCPNGTDTTYSQYTKADCTGQIVRLQLLHDASGARGLWWYYWNTTIGNDATHDAVYNRMMSQLEGGSFRGPASQVKSGASQMWTAPFVTAKNVAALFVWTPSPNGLSYTVPSDYASYLDVNGMSHSVTPGQNITIGVQPLMLMKGYTTHGRMGAAKDSYTRVGKASRANCGPPNYCAYTGSDIASPASVPDMGGVLKNGRIFYDASLPSGNPSPVVRCTDQAIEPNVTIGNQSKSAGLGGSGDAEQLFNTNSTLLRFNTSGNQGQLTLFNPVGMVCGDPVTGYAITSDKNQTNPGSASSAYGFGGGSFSWSDPSVYFGAGSGADAPANGVAKYTINTSTGQFTVQTPYLDFSYGLPMGSLAPAWRPSHAYASGDYVSYTLALADWSGSANYAQGDLILPVTNNPLNCAFKLSTAGTRGTQPSAWSASTDGTCVAAQAKTEGGGTAVWRNIGNSGVFTYQVTSAAGTSGSTTPNFATANGHPDLLSSVSDGSLTWTNTGTLMAPRWKTFAGVSKDSNRFCSGFSSNAYGHPGHYDMDNGGQGTGIYVGCYDFASNTFVLLNTITGIRSSTSCSSGTGYSCTGGTLKLTAVGSAYPAITANCQFEIHNAKGGSTLDYVVIAKQGSVAGTCNGQNLLAWEPFAAFSASNLQIYNAVSNHWTIGKKLFVNVGDQSQLGYGSGAYTALLDSSNPTAAPKTSWQAGPPYTGACHAGGAWHPGDPNLPCNFSAAYDSHTAFWHGPLDDDTGPVCGTMFNYATLAPTPIAPYQGEEVCISTKPSWNLGDPIGGYKVWRFTHTFATGGNTFFDTQFAISQLSQDGKFMAFSSDWNCTLGSTSGVTNSLCGPPWVAGTAYSAGQMINPFGANTGSGTNYGVYQVTTGGVAAATKPAWFVCNSSTAGNTVTDSNGVVYTCLGSNNGKGEVFIVGLK